MGLMIKKTKILNEKELFLLQGSSQINNFLKNKIIFDASDLDFRLVKEQVENWIDSECTKRVGMIIDNRTYTLYFEIGTDLGNFISNFTNCNKFN